MIYAKSRQWKAHNSERVWLSVTLNEVDPAELIISGQIGKNWWDDSGISGKEFRDALNTVPKGQKINLRINSEGGSVQDGLEIYNAIKERNADVTAHISGYAVSIASVIPLAASRVISPTSSVWMIHEPWSMTQGDAEEHLKAAEMLDKHGDMLADIYHEHTGQSKKNVRETMKKETWFTGEEACDWGLADEMGDDEDCNALAQFDVNAFKKLPANVFNLITKAKASLSATQQGAATQTKNNADTLMKKSLIALLNRHGIKNAQGKEWSESDTDEAINAAVEKLSPPTPAPTPAAGETVEQRLARIERNRIVDLIDGYVADNKITKDEASIFVEAALKSPAEETRVMALLDAKPAMTSGTIAGTDFQVHGAPTHNILQGRVSDMMVNVVKDAGNDRRKTYQAIKANLPALRQDAERRDRVRNENTISSSLTTNFLILGATTQASPKFASVKMFSRDTSVDPYKPLATGQMKYNTTVQDGSTTQTNATNFESGDSTVTNVAITVSQYTEAFHLTNGQLNDGIRMEDLVIAKMASLGSKVSKVLAANITAANYSTLTPVIRSTGAFGFSDMQTLWGTLKKANRKHIMLDGPYLANLINIPTLFQPTPVVPGAGWENLLGWDYVALHTEWSAAGNNILGFGCDPQALGVIAGLPLVDSPAIPGGILAQAQGMCVGVDLAIAVYAWFNTSTRTYWASYDLMFGAAALDTTIGCVIATGTPS
jgi:ATP-dependent Clp protease, protease subunit